MPNAICIYPHSVWICATNGAISDGPKYGEEVTIIERFYFKIDNVECVKLAEYNPHPYAYQAQYFIPLNGPDERELIEERDLVLVEKI